MCQLAAPTTITPEYIMEENKIAMNDQALETISGGNLLTTEQLQVRVQQFLDELPGGDASSLSNEEILAHLDKCKTLRSQISAVKEWHGRPDLFASSVKTQRSLL